MKKPKRTIIPITIIIIVILYGNLILFITNKINKHIFIVDENNFTLNLENNFNILISESSLINNTSLKEACKLDEAHGEYVSFYIENIGM